MNLPALLLVVLALCVNGPCAHATGHAPPARSWRAARQEAVNFISGFKHKIAGEQRINASTPIHSPSAVPVNQVPSNEATAGQQHASTRTQTTTQAHDAPTTAAAEQAITKPHPAPLTLNLDNTQPCNEQPLASELSIAAQKQPSLQHPVVDPEVDPDVDPDVNSYWVWVVWSILCLGVGYLLGRVHTLSLISHTSTASASPGCDAALRPSIVLSSVTTPPFTDTTHDDCTTSRSTDTTPTDCTTISFTKGRNVQSSAATEVTEAGTKTVAAGGGAADAGAMTAPGVISSSKSDQQSGISSTTMVTPAPEPAGELLGGVADVCSTTSFDTGGNVDVMSRNVQQELNEARCISDDATSTRQNRHADQPPTTTSIHTGSAVATEHIKHHGRSHSLDSLSATLSAAAQALLDSHGAQAGTQPQTATQPCEVLMARTAQQQQQQEHGHQAQQGQQQHTQQSQQQQQQAVTTTSTITVSRVLDRQAVGQSQLGQLSVADSAIHLDLRVSHAALDRVVQTIQIVTRPLVELSAGVQRLVVAVGSLTAHAEALRSSLSSASRTLDQLVVTAERWIGWNQLAAQQVLCGRCMQLGMAVMLTTLLITSSLHGRVHTVALECGWAVAASKAAATSAVKGPWLWRRITLGIMSWSPSVMASGVVRWVSMATCTGRQMGMYGLGLLSLYWMTPMAFCVAGRHVSGSWHVDIPLVMGGIGGAAGAGMVHWLGGMWTLWLFSWWLWCGLTWLLCSCALEHKLWTRTALVLMIVMGVPILAGWAPFWVAGVPVHAAMEGAIMRIMPESWRQGLWWLP